MLKSELVNLVLGLEGEDLIVGVLAETLAIVGRSVQLLDVINGFVDLATVALVDARLVAQLLAPGVNVLTQGFVLRLQVIELSRCLFASVLKKLDFMLIFSRPSSRRSDSLEVLFTLLKLLTQLFLLVAQDHVSLLLVLVLLGEAVGFTLEALGLRLIDDALHAATLAVTVRLIHSQLCFFLI